MKKQFSVRLRPDQEKIIELMMAGDPELDASKIIRKAIDEYLARSASHREDDVSAKPYGDKKIIDLPATGKHTKKPVTYGSKKAKATRKVSPEPRSPKQAAG